MDREQVVAKAEPAGRACSRSAPLELTVHLLIPLHRGRQLLCVSGRSGRSKEGERSVGSGGITEKR